MANRIIVVRHEITPDNVRGEVQGDSDPPLRPQRGSPKRIYDLTDKLAREIGPSSEIYVFSSESRRAYDTGEGIHDRLWAQWGRMSHVHYTPDLRERGQGVLERKNYAQVLAMLQREQISDPDEARKAVLSILYELDDILGQVPKSEMGEKLERVVGEFERTDGVVIAVGHLVSGLNYLVNLMTTGDIMGNPRQPFLDYPNLHAIVLDRGTSGKYIKTKSYDPSLNSPTGNGTQQNSDTTLAKSGR